MDRKSEFIRMYSNLPLGLRDEVVVLVDEKPLTWNSAYIEIENNTEAGKKILAKLVESGILK